MRLSTLTRAAALIVFTIALAPVRASDQSAEEQIKQLERDRQQAFIRGDIAAIERDTADDYTTINGAGGLSDKPRMMASLQAGRTKVIAVTLDDLTARLYGDAAVLTGVYRDRSVADGVERKVNVRFTRVFVRRNGRWLAVAYQQTPLPQ